MYMSGSFLPSLGRQPKSTRVEGADMVMQSCDCWPWAHELKECRCGLVREPSHGRLRKRFFLEAEYNTPIDLTLLEPAKHVVDGFQEQCLNRGLHFAVCSKRKRLFEVQTSANDGAPYRVAVQH